jgi:hypothetical protein
MAFPKGLSKLGGGNLPDRTKGGQKPTPKGFTAGQKGDEQQTVITHHADGTHSTQHADGSSEEHPDHLHLLASIGHKVSGGDKHHIVHHEAGGDKTEHGINEDGTHYDGADTAASDGTETEQPEEENEPSYGGLRR